MASQTAQLEAEAGDFHGGGLKHAAEVLEVRGRADPPTSRASPVISPELRQVRLTDQLLMLDTMLGDCQTSEGRVLVKAVVSQAPAPLSSRAAPSPALHPPRTWPHPCAPLLRCNRLTTRGLCAQVRALGTRLLRFSKR